MKQYLNIAILILLSLIFCCDKYSNDPIKENPMVLILEEEFHPLSQNPLDWTDEQLGFLDAFKDAKVIGLGEATHGSKEFFDSKHRIFKYLVENHGFKVFAFEADFGESIFLNEAILEGNTSQIKDLMLSKMHFWTWKTTEVQQLLEWMSNYNHGKNDEDKIHYMGIDCQFNTYHPIQVKEYLEQTNQALNGYSKDILDEVVTNSTSRYASLSQIEYEDLLKRIENLIDSVNASKLQLITNSSLKEFQLHTQILNVMKQSLTVGYKSSKKEYSINYRDKYMAKNVEWLMDYFENSKIAVWAHNYHVANKPEGTGGSMGFHLVQSLDQDYKILGFSFSSGSFTAVGMEGEEFTSLQTHTISQEPQTGSLNEIFSRSTKDVFGVSIDDLISYTYWDEIFNSDLIMLELGAVYNRDPAQYYSHIKRSHFNSIIYFEKTKASVILK